MNEITAVTKNQIKQHFDRIDLEFRKIKDFEKSGYRYDVMKLIELSLNLFTLVAHKQQEIQRLLIQNSDKRRQIEVSELVSNIKSWQKTIVNIAETSFEAASAFAGFGLMFSNKGLAKQALNALSSLGRATGSSGKIIENRLQSEQTHLQHQIDGIKQSREEYNRSVSSAEQNREKILQQVDALHRKIDETFRSMMQS